MILTSLMTAVKSWTRCATGDVYSKLAARPPIADDEPANWRAAQLLVDTRSRATVNSTLCLTEIAAVEATLIIPTPGCSLVTCGNANGGKDVADPGIRPVETPEVEVTTGEDHSYQEPDAIGATLARVVLNKIETGGVAGLDQLWLWSASRLPN